VPANSLFAAIAPKAETGGNPVPGRPRAVDLTATLSPAPIGPVTAEFTVTDADGAAVQLSAQAPLPADGRPHVLTVPLGGTNVAYPLRIAQVTLAYTLPEKQQLAAPVQLTVGVATASNWLAAASSSELDTPGPEPKNPLPSADPHAGGWQAAPGGATLTFAPGYGVVYNEVGPRFVPSPAQGQVTLTAASTMLNTVPAIVTRAFIDANKVGAGGSLTATMNGVAVPIHIAAVADTFPTVTGGAMIMDLPTIQSFLISHGAAPFTITQWWLTTEG